jgi:hypothetical protein
VSALFIEASNVLSADAGVTNSNVTSSTSNLSILPPNPRRATSKLMIIASSSLRGLASLRFSDVWSCQQAVKMFTTEANSEDTHRLATRVRVASIIEKQVAAAGRQLSRR